MESSFFDEVHDFQRFVRENIKFIGNYEIISEQLTVSSNETGILDMLAVDIESKQLVILELKNRLTTDKDTWQPLRYFDLIRRGEQGIRELLIGNSHRLSFSVDDINIVPKLVLVVPKCNEQLLRTLSYFEDIDSKVVEVKRKDNGLYISIDKEVYYPSSIFHKEDIVEVKNKVDREWSLEEYKKAINEDKIELARRMLNQIKIIFNSKGYHFDVFFTKTKITITKNKKVWGHFLVSQRPLDYKLDFTFKTDKLFNKADYDFNVAINKAQEQKKGIKVQLNSQIDLNKYI